MDNKLLGLVDEIEMELATQLSLNDQKAQKCKEYISRVKGGLHEWDMGAVHNDHVRGLSTYIIRYDTVLALINHLKPFFIKIRQHAACGDGTPMWIVTDGHYSMSVPGFTKADVIADFVKGRGTDQDTSGIRAIKVDDIPS